MWPYGNSGQMPEKQGRWIRWYLSMDSYLSKMPMLAILINTDDQSMQMPALQDESQRGRHYRKALKRTHPNAIQ